MCYAIPAKVVEIHNNIGIVDYFGEKRKVLVEFIDVEVGDYVYAQGGIAVNKISPVEAEQILDTWKEAFFSLKKIDEDISRVKLSFPLRNNSPESTVIDQSQETSTNGKHSHAVLKILQKINLNKQLSREELLFLMNISDKEELKLLYTMANNLRHRERSNACCVHGIIEFSNYCKNNCFYCGIRKGRNIKRYRMGIEEISDTASHAVNKLGFRALVLQSGEDDWYDEDTLLTIVNKIKKLGVLIILSIGEREKKLYKRLFDAGARGALLRFETSNKKIFNEMRPNTNLDSRLELIRYLKKTGYITATGFIIGLPKEKPEDVINNIVLTKSLKPDMYSFGPLIPTKETPLESHGPISKNTALKAIALTRFIDRNATILITTALETLALEAKREGLLCGANSLMINITPHKYKNLYSIYDHRAGLDIEVTSNIKETIDLLYELGRAPVDLGV